MIAQAFDRMSLAELTAWISDTRRLLDIAERGYPAIDTSELRENMRVARESLKQRLRGLPPVCLGKLPEMAGGAA